MPAQSTNLLVFESIRRAGPGRGVLKISPARTGLLKTYSSIYSDDQLKAELAVCRTFCPEPEPDTLFCVG